MNLFETIIINIIFISFPLVFCLLYQSYHQTLNQRKTDFSIDVALFSAFYLILRFSSRLSLEDPILFLNMPLMIAYYKNRTTDCILLSACMVLYYHSLDIPFPFLLLEYSLYGLMAVYSSRQTLKKQKLIHHILLCKCFFFTIILFYLYPNIVFHEIVKQMILLLAFLVITKFTIYLVERVEVILSLHLKMKDIEKEERVRESLFKITHEIKNPIAVCKGYLDMFDVNKLEHSCKYVPILKEEINRVLILLEDFLSINKIKIEKDIMDVNLLVESIHNNFVPILEDKGIDAHFMYGEDELFMSGDYNRLSQVLINLVKNSIEAIPKEKKGKISVLIEENTSNLKIIVEDNGKGMSQEEISKIKEPFFTTKKRGTGLGIYLSDEIIKGHDGTIEYQSHEGEGTKVTLTFPRKQSDFETISY